MSYGIAIEGVANEIQKHLPPGWTTMTAEAKYQYVLGEVELLFPKDKTEGHHIMTELLIEFFNREGI